MVDGEEFSDGARRLFRDIFGRHGDPPPDLWPKIKAKLERKDRQQEAVEAARARNRHHQEEDSEC